MNQKNFFYSKEVKLLNLFYCTNQFSVVIIAILGIVSNNHLFQAKGNAVTIGKRSP